MNILIVRLSSLADVVHAMPAVQDIRSELPGTRIDWVVEPGFAPLVRRCTAVHRVIECDLRRWRKTVFTAETRTAWRAFMADLQFESYDAVIDLQGQSKSSLVAKMARLNPDGLRYTLTDQAEGSGFEAPTRRVADVTIPVESNLHMVDRSRVMCARSLVYALPQAMAYGVTVRTTPESTAIQNIAQDFFDSGASTPAPVVVLVHGTSRPDKMWPEAHWLDLGHRLNGLGYTVAFVHGSDEEQWRSESIAGRLSQAVVWPRMSTDAMVDAMGQSLGVIGVDNGLCHIAMALDLPVVQICNFNTAWRSGARGYDHQISVFESPTPSVDKVWLAWMQASALASLK